MGQIQAEAKCGYNGGAQCDPQMGIERGCLLFRSLTHQKKHGGRCRNKGGVTNGPMFFETEWTGFAQRTIEGAARLLCAFAYIMRESVDGITETKRINNELLPDENKITEYMVG